jgi:hypothetical protein
MSQYKITAKSKVTYKPFKDQKGNLIWDGKPKLLTLTMGEKEVIDYMFESMKSYTDEKVWTLKKVKVDD